MGVDCGIVAHRLQMPGGAFIGAFIACGLFRILSAQPTPLPNTVSLSIQVLSGILVGSSFDPHVVKVFKNLLPWALLGAVLYLGIGFLLAHLFAMLGALDLETALYSLTPGGLMGMSVISTAEDAQPGVVVMFHMVRVVLVLVFAPFIVHYIIK